MTKIFFLALALFGFGSVKAETIRLPEEELARETVLPVFDRPDSVQNRSVVTAKRLEIAGFGGWTMTDPFFAPLSVGGLIGYQFNEAHGLNLMLHMRMEGVSDYSDQLNHTANVTPLHLENAPPPKHLGLINYQYTAYYGKMSLSKQTVGNIALYGLAGLGMLGIGDGNFPTLSLGIGQKFYLGRNLSLRFDLLTLTYQGPNILDKDVNLGRKSEVFSASAFPKKLKIDTMLNAGVAYLIPGS